MNNGCVLSHSVISNSLQRHVLKPTRLLYPWGFTRQGYWRWLPCTPPGDLPNLVIEPRSPKLQEDSLLSEPTGRPKIPGLGSRSLLQWIFPTQELNELESPALQADSLPTELPGNYNMNNKCQQVINLEENDTVLQTESTKTES